MSKDNGKKGIPEKPTQNKQSSKPEKVEVLKSHEQFSLDDSKENKKNQ